MKISALKIEEGKTTPPSPLTESDLVSCMDKNGIGTDATIHEHIKNVQFRGYVEKKGIHLKPTDLGQALVQTYEEIGINDLYKPDLRANMESKLGQIANGEKD